MVGKRQREVDGEVQPQCTSKRQRLGSDRDSYVEHWLNNSCPSQGLSVDDKVGLSDVASSMPCRSSGVLPSPKDSFDTSIPISRKSERSSASIHDTDYYQSLQYRNIYIEREDAPTELVRRAKRIVSRHRASPEIDNAAVQKLAKKSRQLRNDAEDVIIKQLAPELVPAMKEVPHRHLEMNSDQPWSNSVPIPLKSSILTSPLPLPKPKPDLVFGYSDAAFTENQLGTLELLVDDQFGRSYTTPDQKLHFPFLDIEFKSQAKNGSHYIATNQTANTGAITLNGSMDLIRRSFGMEKYNYEEPQFFSVTMDHELARINIHWVKAPVKGGDYSFHVEGVSKHLLDDAKGLRALVRAIKNILDYGADQRLRKLCTALDAYREAVVRDREAANPQRLRHQAISNVLYKGRQNIELLQEGTSTKNPRHNSVSHDVSANEVLLDKQTTERHRHGSSLTRHAGKSTHNRPPKFGPPSRHAVKDDAEELKSRTRPTQKVIDITDNLGHIRARRKGSHDP